MLYVHFAKLSTLSSVLYPMLCLPILYYYEIYVIKAIVCERRGLLDYELHFCSTEMKQVPEILYLKFVFIKLRQHVFTSL